MTNDDIKAKTAQLIQDSIPASLAWVGDPIRNAQQPTVYEVPIRVTISTYFGYFDGEDLEAKLKGRVVDALGDGGDQLYAAYDKLFHEVLDESQVPVQSYD